MTNESRKPDGPDIADALLRLRGAVDVPPLDPARERAVMAAFDAHWTRPRAASSRWLWSSAAALAVVTVGLNWLVFSAPKIAPAAPAPAADMASFVMWPGAEALPPFESGALVRVEVPWSSLSWLGASPASAHGVVQADIVIGQDGLARAVRLVQSQ